MIERHDLASRRRWKRLSSVLSAALFAVCAFAIGKTRATNFGSEGTVGTSGSTNGVFLANNNIHNVIRRDLTDGYTNGVTFAVSDLDSTDLVASSWTATACSTADLDGYDVCVYDWNAGNNGLWGWNSCVTGTQSGSHPNMVCGLMWVNMNTHFESNLTGTGGVAYAALACHELGHTVGLRHGSDADSCMQNFSATDYLYNTHDRTHINGQY